MANHHIEELMVASLISGGLDEEQASQISNFRLFGNKQGYLLLENTPIGSIPPTPLSRAEIMKPDNISEMSLMQATTILGEPIAYAQESGGNIINNFFPHRELARAATSDSYDTELDLHTENAFHSMQPDFLSLLCLREAPEADAVTYITSINAVLDHLCEADIKFFFEERYNFLSDYSDGDKNCRVDIGKRQTIFYGSRGNPFFRFDPHFMVAQSDHAQSQLQLLREIAWEVTEPVTLKAGDMLIIDNRKTAHARSPFTALFDGTDRWIQRTFAIADHRYNAQKLGDIRVFDLEAEL